LLRRFFIVILQSKQKSRSDNSIQTSLKLRNNNASAKMLFSTFIVAVAAFASAVSAQANFTTCCNVTPSTVDANMRLSWCRAQQNTCPEICQNGQTSQNACDPVRVSTCHER